MPRGRPLRGRARGRRKGRPAMPQTLEVLRQTLRGDVPPPPVARLIGFALTAVEPGRLIATGHLVKGGHTVGLVECDVVDEEGRLVARASSTCLTQRGAQAEGR